MLAVRLHPAILKYRSTYSCYGKVVRSLYLRERMAKEKRAGSTHYVNLHVIGTGARGTPKSVALNFSKAK